MNTQHFDFGVKLASFAYDVGPSEFEVRAAYSASLDASPEVSQLVCKMAASIYECADRKKDFAFHLYDGLSKEASWCDNYNEFSDCVIDALQTIMPILEEEDMQKKAGVRSTIAGLIGRGAGMAPGAVKTLAAAGVLGGGAVGSLAWYANRDVQEDEQDLEALKARVKNYSRITDEINDRLRASGYSPSDSEGEDIVKSTSGAEYVS